MCDGSYRGEKSLNAVRHDVMQATYDVSATVLVHGHTPYMEMYWGRRYRLRFTVQDMLKTSTNVGLFVFVATGFKRLV